MTLAFTFASGENSGEYLRELNPKWQKQKKDLGDKIAKMSR